MISRRQAVTNVTIKDGYTVALGGLTTVDSKSNDKGVPILMGLPVLGNLFKTQDQDYTKTNLIVFVTAKSLNPDGTTYEEIIDPRQLREMSITESDVPGYIVPTVDAEQMSKLRELRQQWDEEELREGIDADIKAIEEEKILKQEAEAQKAKGEGQRAAYRDMQNADAKSRKRL